MHRQLQWLHIRQRVVFKIATLLCGSLSSQAPGCLADDCQLVTDARARQLRFADTRTLTVHRTSSFFLIQDILQLLPREFGTVRRQTYKNRIRILPVQVVVEDIFIWTARQRRLVNIINCAV